eukprot:ANDGO_07485.mRNA.1 Anaphase-promoting complex subunit 6
MDSGSLNQLRRAVQSLIDSRQFKSATFFADQLVSLMLAQHESDRQLQASASHIHEGCHAEHAERSTTSINASFDKKEDFFEAEFTHAVLMLATSLFHSREFARVSFLLRQQFRLAQRNVEARLLCVQAMIEIQDWDAAFDLLGEDSAAESALTTSPTALAAFFFCRGRIYEALENFSRAAHWYASALEADPFQHEAFRRLQEMAQTSADDEFALLESLPPFVRSVYGLSSQNMKHRASAIQDCTEVYGLQLSSSVVLAQTRQMEEQRQFNEALAVIHSCRSASSVPFLSFSRHGSGLSHSFVASFVGRDGRRKKELGAVDAFDVPLVNPDAFAILQPSPYQAFLEVSNPQAQLLFVSILFSLGRIQDLYVLASHNLKNPPGVQGPLAEAVGFYISGVYCLAQRQCDKARKWLIKAVSKHSRFPEAHIAIGHSYTMEDESDQAIAAYRQAQRLCPESHVPLLYLGQEYMTADNFPFAEMNLDTACKHGASDPCVWNELGVLKYRQGLLADASMFFQKALALALAQSPGHRITDGSFEFAMNAAHALRSLAKVDESIELYRQCIQVRPLEVDVYFALGIALHLKGSIDEAILMYHKAQSIQPQFENVALAKFLRAAMESASEQYGVDNRISKR